MLSYNIIIIKQPYFKHYLIYYFLYTFYTIINITFYFCNDYYYYIIIDPIR